MIGVVVPLLGDPFELALDARSAVRRGLAHNERPIQHAREGRQVKL